MKSLKDLFTSLYNDIITKSSLDQFNKWLRYFELRDEHPLMLNSPYLGINRLIFTPKDRSDIFSIFNIDEVELSNKLESIPSFNKEFETISDELNIVLIWLIYKTLNTNIKISKIVLNDSARNFLVILWYKFMSSRLFRIFKHKPDENIMRYTIESLNYRFDIVKYGTWKKLIYEKCNDMIFSTSSIHYKTFRSFSPDDKIYYIISDLKTKINSMISSISELYYENYNLNKSIETYESMVNIDGEKILRDTNYIYDSLIYYIQNQVLNERTFVNEKYINSISNLITSISYPLLYKFLVYICNTAKDQSKSNELNKIETIKNENYDFYYGIHILLYKLISFTFKELVSKDTNLNNKLSIFKNVKSLYSSSKYSNQEFINIKESIKKHILLSKVTVRSVTINGLVTAFVLYIFLKLFEIMKK